MCLESSAGNPLSREPQRGCSRGPPVQIATVYAERDVDVATYGIRVRAALVRSTHQVLGITPRQVRRVQVEGDRQAIAAVTGGTDPHPRGDRRVGDVEFTTARQRQEGGLKAGGVPDGEQLLWIGPWPALAAHFFGNGELNGQPPVGRPAMSRSPALDHRFGGIQDVHVCSSWCTVMSSPASGPTGAAPAGTTSSDVGRWLMSPSVTLPTSMRVTGPLPCEATTTRSACHSAASRRIVSRAAP